MHFLNRNLSASSKAISDRGARERGNILLQVIVVLLALGSGIYFLTSRLQRQRDVTLSSNTVIQVHMGLQSIMDYVYYAVQRRYCLTDQLLTANCELGAHIADSSSPYTSDIAATSARSIERILLSDQQAANMVDMINKNCVDLKLEKPYQPNSSCTSHVDTSFQKWVSKIDIITAASDIAAGNPLFAVIDPLYRSMRNDLKGAQIMIHVQIARDRSVSVPRSGNEVYFTATVRLEDQSGNLLTINNGTQSLQTSSYGTIFPRELGAFSLIVAKNLRLDNSSGLNDVSIPAQANWKGGAGVLFKSPVFVNGNIYLPAVPPAEGGYHGGKNVLYTPVTFGDRVIQGNGIIYAGSNPYVPQSAGGTGDALWSENSLFGGFKLGVSVDNALDQGLQMFASAGAGSTYGSMQQCLNFRNSRLDPSVIGAAALYGALTATGGVGTKVSPQTFEYTFGLVDPNLALPNGTSSMDFNPQTPANGSKPAPLDGTVTSGTGTAFGAASLSPSTSSNAVMSVKVVLGDSATGTPEEADAEMPWGSTLTLTPHLGKDTPVYATLKAKADAESPPGPWTADFRSYQAAMAAPGSITIKLDSITLPEKSDATKSDSQLHLVKMTISTIGANTFYDPNGTPLAAGSPVIAAPLIDLQGYDSRYAQFHLLTSQDPNRAKLAEINLHRRIVFTPTTTPAGPTSIYSTTLSSLDTGGNATIQGPNLTSGTWATPAVYSNPYQATSPYYDNFNYVEFGNQCQTSSGTASGQSFGAAAWNINFSTDVGAVRHSWNFANSSTANVFAISTSGTSITRSVGEGTCPPCTNAKGATVDPCPLTIPDTGTHYSMCSKDLTSADSSDLTFDPTSGAPPASRADFQPWSIVQNCNVDGTATLVAGYFVCDTLTISSRTKPLTMIGTFVVKNLDIDPSALKNGITWMSIYNPDALAILRRTGVLRTKISLQKCSDQITGAPIWDQVSPTVPLLQDMTSCNVLYLRASAQPFQWTAFDPDCGVLPGGTNTVCKHHPVNYFVMEQGRGGGP